jgi:D-beta-D-heptose 7-phosphate kinase/D-beta-D-heptose 1-phosphate adenosyltransferase
MTNFDEIFSGFERARVLIVGDLMLDRFTYGTVSRISPEAPVPVLNITSREVMLGGAGNVAANIAALGANVRLIAVVGADQPGAECASLLRGRARIEPLLVTDNSRCTTVKERYVGQGQQLMRVDAEDGSSISGNVERALVEAFESAMGDADVVALSDYRKGVLTDFVLKEVISLSRQRGVPVIVDPKRADFAAYAGATVIKPNCTELSASTGLTCRTDAEVEAAARTWVSKLGMSLFVTRSADGMSLFRPDKPPVHSRIAAKEVFDVSGAGDTALAVFTAALATGAEMADAMALANVGANLAVSKRGTSIITGAELRGIAARRKTSSALLKAEDIAESLNEWVGSGLRVAIVLHDGLRITASAIHLFQRLENQHDRVCVLVNAGESIGTSDDEAEVIASLDCVDAVTVLHDEALRETLSLAEILGVVVHAGDTLRVAERRSASPTVTAEAQDDRLATAG